MIITGRWAYKKYKKHQREKEEAAKADHTNHEQLVDAGRDEVSKTPILQLGVIPAHSGPPPRYSGLEDSQSLSPSSPAESLSPSSPQGRNEQQASWMSPALFGKEIPSLPPPSPTLSPQPPQQHPTEIAVHGKWVWVADDAPTSAVANQKQEYEPVHSPVASGAVLELPADNTPVELATTTSGKDEGEAFAELDGQPMRTA